MEGNVLHPVLGRLLLTIGQGSDGSAVSWMYCDTANLPRSSRQQSSLYPRRYTTLTIGYSLILTKKIGGMFSGCCSGSRFRLRRYHWKKVLKSSPRIPMMNFFSIRVDGFGTHDKLFINTPVWSRHPRGTLTSIGYTPLNRQDFAWLISLYENI